jgi:hypothetical protein
MPLCGFNQQMINGLGEFQSGLVEHGIINRAKKKNQNHEKTIQKELEDMDSFMKEINSIEDPEIRALTEALTKYSCAFYRLVNKNGINNYKKTIEFLNGFFLEMDNKYYTELEGKSEDMKKLVEYLNTIKIQEK